MGGRWGQRRVVCRPGTLMCAGMVRQIARRAKCARVVVGGRPRAMDMPHVRCGWTTPRCFCAMFCAKAVTFLRGQTSCIRLRTHAPHSTAVQSLAASTHCIADSLRKHNHGIAISARNGVLFLRSEVAKLCILRVYESSAKTFRGLYCSR